jgi:hypothetical protein
MRKYSYSRDVKAGCYQCHGSDTHWFGKNAQGVAARHHDVHGHQTWVEIEMTIQYGKSDSIDSEKETQQLRMEE